MGTNVPAPSGYRGRAFHRDEVAMPYPSTPRTLLPLTRRPSRPVGVTVPMAWTTTPPLGSESGPVQSHPVTSWTVTPSIT
jgi:hypothetical protein